MVLEIHGSLKYYGVLFRLAQLHLLAGAAV